MTASYQLIMRSGPVVGKTFPLEKAEVTVGRDLNNDIVINDAEVSRHQARIYLQGAHYVIEDLGSTNGTTVSGQRLTGPYVLRPGEQITFGEHVSLNIELAQDAATVAGAARPAATAQPPVRQASPAPVPVAAPPPPAPVYAPSPQPPVYIVPERKKGFPVWIIVLILIVLLLICVCGVAFYYIDANNMYCDLLPFLFPGCQ